MMKTAAGRLVHAVISIVQRILSAVEVGAWKKADKAIDEMPKVMAALKKEVEAERKKDADDGTE